MIKNIILTIYLLFSFLVSASSQEIKFRKFNEPYNYIGRGDMLTEKLRWRDDQSLTAFIPFVFRFDDIGSSRMDVHTNGYFSFFNESTNRNFIVLAFFVNDLIDRSYIIGSNKPESLISYRTDTINNELVGKLQFKNAGFEKGGINDSLNMQAWIFEAGNKVQIRFGKSNIQNWQAILNNADTPRVCIFIEKDNYDVGGCLNGLTSNPYLDSLGGYFTNIPEEGTVYEFTFLKTSVYNTQKDHFKYFINDQKITIDVQDELILQSSELIDLLGRTLKSSKKNSIDIFDVNDGIYLLRVNTNVGCFTKRIKI